MYVCICKGITESQVREAVADGATSLCELTARLSVADNCGTCAPVAEEILEESLLNAAGAARSAGSERPGARGTLHKTPSS